MKKLVFGLVIFILVLPLMAGACAKPAPTPTPVATIRPTAVMPTPTAAAATATPTPPSVATSIPTATRPAATATPTPPPTQPKPTGNLRIAMAALGSEALDPILGSCDNRPWQSLMYDFLVGATPVGELDPTGGVAYKWESSGDFKTWTFWLRDGITFWNGLPLTADDVKFSLDRAISPASISSGKANLQAAIDNVEVVDPHKLVIHLKVPYLYLPIVLSPLGPQEGEIVSKSYFEKVGAERFAMDPMGSGPYRLLKSEPGIAIRLEALDQHWRFGVPKVKEVDFLRIPEQATQIAMLQRGEVDVIPVSRQGSVEVQKAGYTVFEKPDAAVTHVLYTEQWVTGNPLSNEKVRKALNLAINRQEIIDFLLYGRAEVTGMGFVGSWHFGYDASAAPPYPYDPGQARRLLQEAGYGNGFDLDVYSYVQFPEQAKVNEALVSYWQAIGVNARLVPVEYAAFRKKWGERTIGVGVASLNTPNRLFLGLENVMGSKGSITVARDPILDVHIAAMTNATSLDAAKKAMHDFMAYVSEHNILGPLFGVGELHATRSDIKEWKGVANKYEFDPYFEGLLRRW